MINRKRSSGILLHISSLMSPYGIGDFGNGARDFIDFLQKSGFHYWQVLPFTRTDACNSPYKSDSAFAGNAYFIDLAQLADLGLLTEEELRQNEYEPPYAVNYKWLAETRIPLLKTAYKRADEGLMNQCRHYADTHPWLADYALYMVLKEQFNADWLQWPDNALKNHDADALNRILVENADRIEYYYFEQYMFALQWQKILEYAHAHDVYIIGDMPFYVSLESADVWSNRELFDLNADGSPAKVAGVPPDYFSENGQKWGNPLYNWNTMRLNRFEWWKQRLQHTLNMFDKVRIDHFRAFSAYWAVPAKAPTAKEGKWIDGVGMEFFDEIFKIFDKSGIIAEDLGIQDKQLTALLKESGLPGMRVMQFGFLSHDDDMHLPHNYSYNTVAYSGTHDNTTLLNYLWEITPDVREYCLKYCGYTGTDWQSGGSHNAAIRSVLQTLWKSHAFLTISPIQDLCGFGGDTTMNKPGTTEDNWVFRLTPDAFLSIDIAYLRQLNDLYKRS